MAAPARFRRLRSRLGFKSIRTTIAVSFFGLILFTAMVLSLNTYLLSSDAVRKNSIDYTSQLMVQVSANIQNYIGNMTSISDFAAANGSLQALMRLRDPRGAEGRRLAEETQRSLRSIADSRDDIVSILFVGANGALVSDRDGSRLKPYANLISQDWYVAAAEAGGGQTISSSRVQHLYYGEYRWVVSISRQLPGEGTTAGGVLLVDLNYNVINNLGQQIEMAGKGYVFVVDTAGNLVFHPRQQLIYSDLKSEAVGEIMQAGDGTFETVSDGRAKIYTVRSTGFGWKIVGVNYPEALVSNKRAIQLSALLWGGVALGISLALSLLLSAAITRPVKKLETQMKKVERGDFDARADVEAINEIGKLAKTFNLMTGRIKELVGQVVAEQEEKRASELKALQAQIRPHFLYNTLDSIIWMAEMEKQAEVVQMTSALARLLRYSIGTGEERVALREELAHAENYLTIQSIRYRGKLTYSIEVEAGLQEHPTLKIILQPLLENAIYHGIKNKPEGGHIRISGIRDGRFILLFVADDGIGMKEETLARLRSGRFEQSGTGGVGLANVNERLKLNYGESGGLTFESELDEGTVAGIRIPYQAWVEGGSPLA